MSYLKSDQVKEKKKNGKKSPTRKTLIRQLDDEIRRICRARDTHCCSCGKKLTNTAQVSHYISRRVYKLRWNLRNVAMSCPGCNLRHNFDPEPYTSFLIKKYGKGVLDEFREIKNTVHKITTPELREMLEQLKQL